MHRVPSAGNTSGSLRPRQEEKKLSYVFNDVDDVTKHAAGVNCLAVLKSSDGLDHLFTGGRDGTLKKWALTEDGATYSATFESHMNWVNDAVIVGGNTLISCSSDTSVKAWDCSSSGTCIKTFNQHSDYATCLASAGKNSNIVASGGFGAEVFIWDLESALTPLSKSSYASEDDSSNGVNGSGGSSTITGLRPVNSSNNISLHPTQSQKYVPIAAKGHKESVYAVGMNETGTVLVSGGTEKVVRVWDPRSGSKTMKLRGHTDNIRALLLDSTGRFCLSGSSDSMIRLWDLGQQRCIHTYAVHTDSVWALATTPSFGHVYSGGRDLSLCLTDLATRESVSLCTREHPILKLALHGDDIWIAATDSVDKYPAEVQNPQKVIERGVSFLAGNSSFSRSRVSPEGSIPASVYKEPSYTILGIPGIVKFEILNNKIHILTKDSAGIVKLWEITRGVVIENFGEVSFEKKKEELYEMEHVLSWFTADIKVGCLSIHMESPTCFLTEMYSAELNISGKPEDDKVNIGRETLKGLMADWLSKRRRRIGSQDSGNAEHQFGKELSSRALTLPRFDTDGNMENDSVVYAPFEFSVVYPPSIATEGSQGSQWRKKVTDLDGSEDEKDFPLWVLDCVLNNRLPPRESTKIGFYLQPCDASAEQIVTQGKLSAPRILKIHKVVNYIVEKFVLDNNKPLDNLSSEGPFSGLHGGLSNSAAGGDLPFLTGQKPKLKPSIEIFCNKQVLSPDMSLSTVQNYIWKNPNEENVTLNFRVLQGR